MQTQMQMQIDDSMIDDDPLIDDSMIDDPLIGDPMICASLLLLLEHACA
jgi:hypothetical protein